MDNQTILNALLKKKGTGPTMSKSLFGDELTRLETCLADPSVTLTTKATILTALLTLDPNPEEARWLDKLRQNPSQLIGADLEVLFFKPQSANPLIAAIQTAISHTDLSYSDFSTAMTQVIDADTPNYLKGAFLEAERLKRETLEENSACFDVLWNAHCHESLNVETLIDLANPYDGFKRYPNFTLFVAPLLASIGFPTILSGCYEVAPKKGITSHKLLIAAGKQPKLTLSKLKIQIENPAIRWGYVDQEIAAPKIHNLTPLRIEMVKRPILATIEKLLQPFHATKNTILVTGYTHPAYKEMLQNLLKLKQNFSQTLMFRGQEGSIQLPLDRRAPYVYFDTKSTTTDFVRPEDFGIDLQTQDQTPDISVDETLARGLEALRSTPGQNRQILLYLSASIVTLGGLMPKDDALVALNNSLDSGLALNIWHQGH